MRFFLQTLGCPKNEVDSEGMVSLLLKAGHRLVADPRQADLLILNTCGFIEAAKQESLQALKDLSARKRRKQRLVAAGCLAQRSADLLRQEVPGLDAVLGTRDWDQVADLALRLGFSGDEGEAARIEGSAPLAGRRSHKSWAYLKIADGCDIGCAFCTIPSIKGPYRSRPPAEIVAEARSRVDGGVKEIVLVAQDTTRYGRDIGWEGGLAALLTSLLTEVPDLKWLRLMYAYPTMVTDRLLEVMAGQPQICRYLDLPLQHSHPAVLRRMKRPHDARWGLPLLTRMRSAMPDLALRTAFIVGFPGETEDEFEDLLHFVKEVRFDRMGAFMFSREEGTPAADLPGQIPEDVKQDRHRRLMLAQLEVSMQANRAMVGSRLQVLVEGLAKRRRGSRRKSEVVAPGNQPWLVGRSYRDAPEVDGLVLLEGEAKEGDFVDGEITGYSDYDLVGRVVQFSAEATTEAVAR